MHSLALALFALGPMACDAGEEEGEESAETSESGETEAGEQSSAEAKDALLECGLPQPCAVVELDGETHRRPLAERTAHHVDGKHPLHEVRPRIPRRRLGLEFICQGRPNWLAIESQAQLRWLS